MGAPQISVQILYRPVAEIEWPDLPTKDAKTSEYKFWKEQIRRCMFGYVAEDGKFINGIQYFYNNFVTTEYYHPTLKEKKESRPLWRDNDNDITDEFWDDLPRLLANGKYKNAVSHIEIKARRKGWTYIDLLAVNLYIFVFYPEWPIGSAYIDDENITPEKEMFRQAWLKLPPIFHRWKGCTLNIVADNKVNGEFSVGYKDPKTKTSKVHNTWWQKIVDSVNPGVFKGFTYRRINVVEAGKWKQKGLLKKFLAQNNDCLRFGEDYVGSYSIGGTSDEIEGIDTDYKLIYFDRKTYPYSRHMTSAIKVHASFFDVNTGRTDEAAALQYEIAAREAIKNDHTAYHTYVVENPLNEEEMFVPKSQYAYDTKLLQTQIQEVLHNEYDKYWVRGKIVPEYDLNGQEIGYKFQQSQEGEWLVHSKYGLPDKRFKNLYVAGIDDKYKSQKKERIQSNSSKSAMVIKIRKHNYDFPSDRPIAIYLSPSLDLDATFYEFYKGMMFWDIEKSLYEYNHEAFVSYYLKDKKAQHRLFYVDDQPGVTVTGAGGIMKEVTLLGNQFMAAGRYQNIDSPELLNALKKWGGPENTDIGSAWHLVLKLEDLMKETPVLLNVDDSKYKTTFMVLSSWQSQDDGFIELGVPDRYRKNAG